ncbi:MAG: hypothetical protein JXR97_11265 [Planctomycetes bacterium]|nr:hypothetical protein [Planctomycetota bacterium]
MTNSNDQTRREFIRSCGRLAAAGGLAALTIFGLTKKGSADCSAFASCSDCASFGDCRLDKAEKVRRRK